MTAFATALVAAFGVNARAAVAPCALTTKDVQQIKAITLAYRDAWVANDANAVMATLTADAVLLPSGLAPISGTEPIRAVWWPAGPPTRILAMELTIEEVGGSGPFGYARGHGSLSFSFKDGHKDKVVSQRSTFLNIFERQRVGGWRISRRMWSDLK